MTEQNISNKLGGHGRKNGGGRSEKDLQELWHLMEISRNDECPGLETFTTVRPSVPIAKSIRNMIPSTLMVLSETC